MNEQQNIQAKHEANQDHDSAANKKTSKGSMIVDHFGKILLTICGVLMAAIVVLSLTAKSIAEDSFRMIGENHDAIVEMRVEQRMRQEANRKDIDKNTKTGLAIAIDQKGTEKALLLVGAEMKHLRSDFDIQSKETNDKLERTNAKLDTLGLYWQQFNTSATQ